MGNGGYQSRHVPPAETIRELLNKSQAETDERANQTEVEAFLKDLLKEINDHDYMAIDRHRRSILDALQLEFEVEQMNFGGSHSRRTDIAGLSDIDILAVLGSRNEMSTSSIQAVKMLGERLRQRFPSSTIEGGSMAVTVQFSDGIEVQVLPAYRRGKGYLVPDPKSGKWLSSNPAAFSRRLTAANKSCNGQVVPTVKLIKSLLGSAGIKLKSYHIENLALKAFEHYPGPNSKRQMVRHFLNSAKNQVTRQMSDLTGQSRDLSDYLSTSEKRLASVQLAMLERQLSSNSINEWKKAFG